MGQVRIKINGRAYPINCADGEEDHLRQLGGYLESVVRELTDKLGSSSGQISDTHLLVMAGITIADKLSDLYGEKDSAFAGASDDDRQAFADAVDAMAGRLEDIAARLETA